MENRRLKELKLSFYINYIDSAKDKLIYSKLMKVLSCLVGALGKEEHTIFTNITMASVGGNLLNATDKEIVATAKTFFSNREAARLLGITYRTFYNRYGDLLSRDFITNEFLDNEKPMFDNEKAFIVVDLVTKFIESFKFKIGNDDNPIRDNERTLEIEFWLIYDKVISILQNNIICDKFMFNLCNLFSIDYNDIAQLKNNVHVINRQYPNFRYNNRYFMQEIVYLYTQKGLTKCQIASKVFNKNSNYLYIGTNKKYNELVDSNNVDWQYVPTLDWTYLKKGSVIKFIDIFHTFINYDI